MRPDCSTDRYKTTIIAGALTTHDPREHLIKTTTKQTEYIRNRSAGLLPGHYFSDSRLKTQLLRRELLHRFVFRDVLNMAKRTLPYKKSINHATANVHVCAQQ